VAHGSSAAPTARRTALVAIGLALALGGCSAGQLAQTAYVQPAVDGANGQAGPIALRNIKIAYPAAGRYQQGDSARLELFAANTGDQADSLTGIRTDIAGSVRFDAGTGGSATPSGTAAETPSATGTPTATATGTGSAPATTTPAPTGSAGSPTASATGTGGAAGTGSATATATATATASSPAAATVALPPEALTSFREGGPVITLVGLTRSLLPAEVVQITFVFRQAGEVTINVPVEVPSSPLPPAPTIDLNGESTAPG
jgi:copper(I)-binding protein